MWVKTVIPVREQWMIKWREAMREILGELTSAWVEAERR